MNVDVSLELGRGPTDLLVLCALTLSLAKVGIDLVASPATTVFVKRLADGVRALDAALFPAHVVPAPGQRAACRLIMAPVLAMISAGMVANSAYAFGSALAVSFQASAAALPLAALGLAFLFIAQRYARATSAFWRSRVG
jgi:hypothetical protein